MYLERSEEVRFPGAGVVKACEPPSGFQEVMLGTLQEQQVPLTAEPCL